MRRKHKPKTRLQRFKSDAKRNPEKPSVLAEGDSWLGRSLPGKNLGDYVEESGKYNFFNIANSGEEMLEMLSGVRRKRLKKYLQFHNWDYILWSGGGNDIFADLGFYMEGDRMIRRMKQLEYAYKDLADLRDTYAPHAQIITHNYDRVQASGKALKVGLLTVAGPWLKPALEAREVSVERWDSLLEGYMIAYGLLLDRLSREIPNFKFVRTHGTISPDEWSDELHPNEAGFEKLANVIISNL